VGLPRVADYNRSDQTGIGYVQRTIRDGRRASAADSFLTPARHRPNLTVLTQRNVRRVLIENGRAVGVECHAGAKGETLETWRAEREVLLAAGGLQSPQLLQLSGIGPGEWLREAGIPVLLDCWAEWCAPCHMLAPTIDALARDYAGRVLVGKLDVDANPATAARFEIRGIPTLLVFDHGQLVDRLVGVQPRPALEARLAPLLAAAR
ncbi:MAG TPA: thioredoxin, partial [Methylomirabilota bacterium]